MCFLVLLDAPGQWPQPVVQRTSKHIKSFYPCPRAPLVLPRIIIKLPNKLCQCHLISHVPIDPCIWSMQAKYSSQPLRLILTLSGNWFICTAQNNCRLKVHYLFIVFLQSTKFHIIKFHFRIIILASLVSYNIPIFNNCTILVQIICSLFYGWFLQGTYGTKFSGPDSMILSERCFWCNGFYAYHWINVFTIFCG
jgi:hypothetical protein